jgi:hypothetical protein
MHFNFYDNKVLASAKCGSRYLDSIYGVPENGGFPTPIVLPKGTKLTPSVIPPKIKVTHHLTSFSKLNLNDIKWIIIRPPMDLLVSAIHTELILNWSRNKDNLTEKDIVHNLTFSDWNCAHYQFNLYKEMFLKSINNTNIKFVKLEDLTTFCELELNIHKRYEPSDFDFNNINGYGINKNMTMEYFKLQYPYHHSLLMKNIPIDEIFYNLIINSKSLWKVDVETTINRDTKNFL